MIWWRSGEDWLTADSRSLSCRNVAALFGDRNQAFSTASFPWQMTPNKMVNFRKMAWLYREKLLTLNRLMKVDGIKGQRGMSTWSWLNQMLMAWLSPTASVWWYQGERWKFSHFRVNGWDTISRERFENLDQLECGIWRISREQSWI